MVAGVSQGLVGWEGGLRKCLEGGKAEKGGAGGLWKSQKWHAHTTFEFLKGTVIASRLSEEVEAASVSHTLGCRRDGLGQERSETRLARGWRLTNLGGTELCPANQILFHTGRTT